MIHKAKGMAFSALKAFKFANILIANRAGCKVSWMPLPNTGVARFMRVVTGCGGQHFVLLHSHTVE